MPKVKSSRRRSAKSQPFEPMSMEDTTDRLPEEAETPLEDEGASNRSVHKRQAAEWKRMKAQVAQLKQRRRGLTRKQREVKKQISQEIKLLISSMSERHENELRELGIVAPKRSDVMEDDLDDE